VVYRERHGDWRGSHARTGELEATLSNRHYLHRHDDLIRIVSNLHGAETPDDVMALQIELCDRVTA
jgi:hypothetical protein